VELVSVQCHNCNKPGCLTPQLQRATHLWGSRGPCAIRTIDPAPAAAAAAAACVL